MAFEKSVGAVVFRRPRTISPSKKGGSKVRGEEKGKIKYLLIKHPESGGYQGHWDFPKGHIEKGESWQETLQREVKEETGITKLEIVPDFYTWIKYFYRAKGKERQKRKKQNRGTNIFKIVTYYLAESKQKKVKLSFEHENYAWLEYRDALRRITFENGKKVLRKAHQFLKKEIKSQKK